ncbi:F0F1 ATP synthase subunit I [Endozoicomonas ascidiicola]|uniref:F0F1 ATP synthase subunit I n=1 Tax=Endozoicomonas ascidiicola TaxID=1698521 RepID=UPI001FE0C57C|nr:F0F1 ATP synthase subunit I [Endozoicomonas ascidiicola]
MSEAKAWKHQMAMRSDEWAGFWKNKTVHTDRRQYAWLQSPPVYRVVVAQFAVCTVLTLALLPLGTYFALSSLLGGLCCALPNAYFVGKAFRYRGARSAKQIVSSFYRGEAGKLVLTTVGFILIFTQVKPIEPLALFGAFVAVQSVSWFAPLLVVRRQS